MESVKLWDLKKKIFIWSLELHLVCHHSSNNRSSFNYNRTCIEYKRKRLSTGSDSSKSREHLTILLLFNLNRKILLWHASVLRTRALHNFYLQNLMGKKILMMRFRQRSPWFKLNKALEWPKKRKTARLSLTKILPFLSKAQKSFKKKWTCSFKKNQSKKTLLRFIKVPKGK